MYDGAEMKKRLEEREERWSESLLSHSTSADTHAFAIVSSPLYRQKREGDREIEGKSQSSEKREWKERIQLKTIKVKSKGEKKSEIFQTFKSLGFFSSRRFATFKRSPPLIMVENNCSTPESL